MVLDDNEAIKVLKESIRVPEFIQDARTRSNTLRALLEGDDFKSELSRVEGIEKSEDKWKARQKYSRSIVDLNERTFRPLDNVYSATGASKHYNIKSDRDKKNLIDTLSKIRGGISLEKWLQNNWMPTYHYDPSGVIFLESKNEKPYPTYKSINAIRNYKWYGQNLEWIVFEPKKKKIGKSIINTIRLVDDAMDRTYRVEGSSFTIIEDLTFPIIYGACPGLITSDITKVGYEEIRLSPVWKIVEIEQEYLRDQSMLTIVKFLNGFKNLVRPKVLCTTCHGTKKTGDKDCSSCDATGFMINKDLTDEIILPIDITDTDAKIPDANTLAAWIGLDVETWDQYRKELEILAVLIFETVWGSHQVRNTTERTATEIWVNTQPVINRLNKYSDIASHVEWQLTEWIANYVLDGKDKDERISSINYGKRFIIDPPDELLNVYSSGKEANLSPVILDRQLIEYITAKYSNDMIQLKVELLKMKLDLYIHYDIETVQKIYGDTEARKKGLFAEWWGSLKMTDYDKSFEVLENERDNYFTDKLKLIKDGQD